MATEENGASSGQGDQQKEQKGQKDQKPKQEQPSSNAAPKLSGAELKAKKQAEKAARRAQTVAAKTASAGAPGAHTQGAPQGGAAGNESKGGKQGKPKQDAPPSSGPAAGSRPGTQRRQSTAKREPPAATAEKDPGSVIPECFSHLPVAKRIQLCQADKDVHPAVLVVGQQMATFTLRDNIARLEATLLAFKKVLKSYETPQGHVFSRYFVPHVLNPQIEYLTECRPMCFAMGNAIRLLKARVTKLDVDLPDEEAVKELCEAIDGFIQERIAFAEYVIANNAAEMIMDSDIVLTFGHQRLVRRAVLQAWASGKKFDVAIVDDPYDHSGQDLAKLLRQEGIRVSYYPHLGGLRVNLKRATKVLLGAESMFANGSLYGPVGTCDIAMAATALNVPVIALCETINFDRDRVATDSLTYNEIDPERRTADSFRLLFDTTREQYISVVVTEYETGSGNSPATAILSILRKQEDPN